MIAFYTHYADADVPELARLARTVSRWSEEIFAYRRTGQPLTDGSRTLTCSPKSSAVTPTDSEIPTTIDPA